MVVENVTGWSELMDGNIVKAAFNMYDTALLHWPVAILFFVFQFMLYTKTKNLTLCWVTGIFFACLYGVSSYVKPLSIHIMFLMLTLELAGIFFMWLFRK